MAQKIMLIDDIDGTSEADFSVEIILNGYHHALDLNAAHMAALQTDYISHARHVGSAKTSGKKTVKPASKSNGHAAKPENQQIREWAKTQPDIELADRGRIPEPVRVKFQAATAA